MPGEFNVCVPVPEEKERRGELHHELVDARRVALNTFRAMPATGSSPVLGVPATVEARLVLESVREAVLTILWVAIRVAIFPTAMDHMLENHSAERALLSG